MVKALKIEEEHHSPSASFSSLNKIVKGRYFLYGHHRLLSMGFYPKKKLLPHLAIRANIQVKGRYFKKKICKDVTEAFNWLDVEIPIHIAALKKEIEDESEDLVKFKVLNTQLMELKKLHSDNRIQWRKYNESPLTEKETLDVMNDWQNERKNSGRGKKKTSQKKKGKKKSSEYEKFTMPKTISKKTKKTSENITQRVTRSQRIKKEIEIKIPTQPGFAPIKIGRAQPEHSGLFVKSEVRQNSSSSEGGFQSSKKLSYVPAIPDLMENSEGEDLETLSMNWDIHPKISGPAISPPLDDDDEKNRNWNTFQTDDLPDPKLMLLQSVKKSINLHLSELLKKSCWSAGIDTVGIRYRDLSETMHITQMLKVDSGLLERFMECRNLDCFGMSPSVCDPIFGGREVKIYVNYLLVSKPESLFYKSFGSPFLRVEDGCWSEFSEGTERWEELSNDHLTVKDTYQAVSMVLTDMEHYIPRATESEMKANLKRSLKSAC